MRCILINKDQIGFRQCSAECDGAIRHGRDEGDSGLHEKLVGADGHP